MPAMQVIGADKAARDLIGLGAKVQAGLGPLVAHYGQIYQGRVRARASGRPGPRVQTGDYRRSIGLVLGSIGGSLQPSAIVGTNSPQGRRLEFGFVGTDSLGRHYNQGPLPHFEPDLYKTGNELQEAAARLIDGAGAA